MRSESVVEITMLQRPPPKNAGFGVKATRDCRFDMPRSLAQCGNRVSIVEIAKDSRSSIQVASLVAGPKSARVNFAGEVPARTV